MAAQILVPLDGSPMAEQALPCAMTLAQGLGVELVLLSAVSIPSDAQEILSNAGVEADALVDQLAGKADDTVFPLVIARPRAAAPCRRAAP
jgi:nucleotide-binding universal stress UspA family protein